MCDDCGKEYLESYLAEAYAQIETIGRLMDGEPVSDFDLSFPVARRLADFLGQIRSGSRVVVTLGSYKDQCGWVEFIAPLVCGDPETVRYNVRMDSGEHVPFPADHLVQIIP